MSNSILVWIVSAYYANSDGLLSRLFVLSEVVAFCNFLCFDLSRLCLIAPTNRASSLLLLYGGAGYLITRKDGLYCLDTASAGLNGLLSIRTRSKW
ncbi:hypothetical protein THRCLA_20153 [Thraustotheca clavata]|uniref:Uncharacterized protein n=1 Tax=Thraustotheca clavata TaxID=74557 RepID=A0A1W0AB07_9STRA|nr:hypothetical protein THRCLA_20153 [Thraustotheca clavata]